MLLVAEEGGVLTHEVPLSEDPIRCPQQPFLYPQSTIISINTSSSTLIQTIARNNSHQEVQVLCSTAGLLLC